MKGNRYLDGVDEKTRAHLEPQIQENLNRGMSLSQARTAAMRESRSHMAASAEAPGFSNFPRVQNLWQDLRYTFRQLRLAPAFSATVVLTIGLCIGATTAIFSLVHAVLLKSLPVADPSHLYRIGAAKECCHSGVLQEDWEVFSYSLYKRIEESTPQFDNIAAFQAGGGILSVRVGQSNVQAKALLGEYVSGNYFETFGVKPYAGRLLSRNDDRPNATPVAVLSYRTWQQEYNSDPSVLGSTFRIETYPFTIVGIAPPGFFGETLQSTPPQIWIPLQSEFLIDGRAAFNLIPSQAWLHLIGHVRPGATLDGVTEQLSSLLQHWLITEAALPAPSRPHSSEELHRQIIRIAPGGQGIGVMRQTYGSTLRILLAICFAVLLVGCANVANLFLSRGLTRRLHVALQLSLGASRQRILAQVFTESATLAILGGLLGICLAYAGAKGMIALAFRHVDVVPLSVQPSLPVLGFCFALSLMTGLLFGIAPAWASSRISPSEFLRGVNRSTAREGCLGRSGLIILQASLSVILIAVAGMLAHSMFNLEQQKLGFATKNRLIVAMEPPLADYTLPQLSARYRDLKERLERISGVDHVGLALSNPVSGGWKEAVIKPGQGIVANDEGHMTRWNRISPGYLQTMGMPILEGRDLQDADADTTRGVAVVNQAFVKRFFPGQTAIGKHFGLRLPAYSDSLEIIGVVADAKAGNLRDSASPTAFGTLAQHIHYEEETLQASDKWDHFIDSVLIQYSGESGNLEPRIREAFRQVDPNFAIISIQPVEQLVAAQFDQQRIAAQLAGMLGTLALVLALIGLYGATAYSVARKNKEMGIRMAVGANRTNIMILVFRGAFLQVLLGIAVGLPVSMLLGKGLSARLYEVGSLDPVSLILAIAVMAAGAFLASLVPAFRAAGIDPVKVLASE